MPTPKRCLTFVPVVLMDQAHPHLRCESATTTLDLDKPRNDKPVSIAAESVGRLGMEGSEYIQNL